LENVKFSVVDADAIVYHRKSEWEARMTIDSGKIESIVPFGVILHASTSNQRGTSLFTVSGESILELVKRHQLVVARGFEPLPSSDFIRYAESLGTILEWNFGKILDVEVHDDPKNYLFTHGDVPLHWDGAFAEHTPHLQFFQCREAPRKSGGGETVFVDTQLVLTKNPDKLKKWQETTISYSTEKIAHYGGTVVQKLINVHPKTGALTIRFAEPMGEHTTKENPLEVKVHDASVDEQEQLISELQKALYDPTCSYLHSWNDGDYIFADNHALLHGRRPFIESSPRHLQRIHIL
jgi:alpha-ketoglutarate-dependent taurine dioxygenase